MNNITSERFRTSIQDFLNHQIDKKTKTEKKQLAQALEDQDYEKVAELQQKIFIEEQKFNKEIWIQQAAEKFTNQLTFGTHISKGIHPDSKGDNIIFHGRKLPDGILGSQTIKSNQLDANGNAAALPLAAFFEWSVENDIKIRDLIKSSHPSIDGSFSSEQKTSDYYQKLFVDALNSETNNPKSHGKNKQILFPLNDKNAYQCIIPLYPSTLTHSFYHTLNDLRYSEQNKTARNNRFKKTAEQASYITINDIAMTKLGGTKPQNVSQLMSQQGGRNYLLPSMPPIYKNQNTFKINRRMESIFNKQIAYRCQKPLDALIKLMRTNYNNLNIRDARKFALDSILFRVISIAIDIQNNERPGWSISYNLNHSEKLWLDKFRATLEGQEKFKQERVTQNWRDAVATRFANWLNQQIQLKIKHLKYDFGDQEHIEWKSEMNEMIKESQRLGKEVFA